MKKQIEWKLKKQELDEHDAYLDIMDAKEILPFIDWDEDEYPDNFLVDNEWSSTVANYLYKEVKSGKERGFLTYAFTLVVE